MSLTGVEMRAIATNAGIQFLDRHEVARRCARGWSWGLLDVEGVIYQLEGADRDAGPFARLCRHLAAPRTDVPRAFLELERERSRT